MLHSHFRIDRLILSVPYDFQIMNEIYRFLSRTVSEHLRILPPSRLPMVIVLIFVSLAFYPLAQSESYNVIDQEKAVRIETARLEATINKEGYVSGIAGGSFLDKATGFRDMGHGLSIADFILEAGSDLDYRHQLDPRLVYEFDNMVHGNRPKRKVEGPQICTQARQLTPEVIEGRDFVAVRMKYQFPLSAPGRATGSVWTQTIVFPSDKRFYISSQRIDSVNASPEMFFRIDMPGHIKHENGDTFSEIYLSYLSSTNTPDLITGTTIPSSYFTQDFPPDQRFNYRRQTGSSLPDRFIRAYRIRNPATGEQGPWLAGMTLDPSVVYEAWCHQRGYVSMIQEFGGRAIRPGESFSAAFLVGFFDSIEEMHQVYDQYSGHREVVATPEGWQLLP